MRTEVAHPLVDVARLTKVARDVLGLKQDLLVTAATLDDGVLGEHGWGSKYGHCIWLDHRLPRERIDATLWHELTHAVQAEATPNWPEACKNAEALFGYHGSPYEREARRVSRLVAPKFPLTKESA